MRRGLFKADRLDFLISLKGIYEAVTHALLLYY